MRHLNHKLLLTALISMVCANSFAHDIAVANSGKTIYYNFINDNTELAVTYRGSSYTEYSNEYSGKITIPKTVTYNSKTYRVTKIGASAFKDCTGMTSVTIPNSVTTIESSAFSNCDGLTSVTIPNSVTDIGMGAFGSNDGLTSVTIPNSVTTINNSLFAYCTNLTSVTIPNSVTSIEYAAFRECTSLTSVTIPNSVTSIDIYAFRNCTSLTSVKVGWETPISNINATAFTNCANAILYVPAGSKEAYEKATVWKEFQNIVEYINFADENVKAICVQNWDTNGDGELSLDEAAAVTSLGTVFKNNEAITSFDELQYFTGLTSIGDYAFQNCSGLTSVTIPNSVTSIENYAFEGCSGLTSVTIPNSVTSIGIEAFQNCSGLVSITIPNSVTSIGIRAFYGCSSLTSVTIPNGVTTINSYTFYGCNSLTSVTIPNGVTTINNRAFGDCSSLTSVTIGNSVTSIGQYAFVGCSSLTSVIIPNSVTSIDNGAFYNCSSLTNVTIPNSVTSIGSAAFYNCSNLTAVKVGMENPVSITSGTFSNRANATLYVPRGSKSAYLAANYWKQFKEIVEYEIILDENSEDGPMTCGVPLDVRVLRTIKGGEWSTICLPFAMTGEQVSAAFGSVELADFSDYQATKKGDKTISIMINFAPVDAADGMEANHPYLIRTADDISDFTVTNVILAPDKENAQTAFTTEEDGQTVSKGFMKGTYHAQTIVPADNLFVSANKFYYSTGKTKMMAYRAYFYLADRLDRNESASAKISFMFNESSTDRIEDVEVRPAASSAIFDIQGRKVADSADGLQGLPKGIYIINGKKVVR